MKFVNATAHQILDLFGGNISRNLGALIGIFVETVETLIKPIGNAGTAGAGKTLQLCQVLDRHDARYDRNNNAGGTNAIMIALEGIIIEEELRQGPVGAIIGLAFQHLDVGCCIAAFRMFFRIGRHGNIEITTLAQSSDQIGGIGIAARMRLVSGADTTRWVGPRLAV